MNRNPKISIEIKDSLEVFNREQTISYELISELTKKGSQSIEAFLLNLISELSSSLLEEYLQPLREQEELAKLALDTPEKMDKFIKDRLT